MGCWPASSGRSDTIDYLVDMHDKLMTSVHNRAQEDIDEELRKRRQMIRSVLVVHQTCSVGYSVGVNLRVRPLWPGTATCPYSSFLVWRTTSHL
jgi:hypothetical protein